MLATVTTTAYVTLILLNTLTTHIRGSSTNNDHEQPPEGTGVDCYASCQFKSGTCTTGCGARRGLGIPGHSYKCCRKGWNPSGDCNLIQGCVNRHCCVHVGEAEAAAEAEESTDPNTDNNNNNNDPTCATGVVSADGFICSPSQCQISDGRSSCSTRSGGEACCSHKVLESAPSCDVSLPPCIISPEQLSKIILSCPDPLLQTNKPTYELTNSKLLNYQSSSFVDKMLMDFSLDSGALFVDESNIGGNSDVIDLSGETANVLLRKKVQPDSTSGDGFTVCIWFKATEALDPNGAEYNPLASTWIDGKGWELRLNDQSQVSFVLGTQAGPIFQVSVKIKGGHLDTADGRTKWHHACGIYYGSTKSQVGVLVNGMEYAMHSLPFGTAVYRPVTTVGVSRIGRNLGNPRRKFRGFVAGFKIWSNRAISPSEMVHIAGACGGGGASGSGGVAVGSFINAYGNVGSDETTTAAATDTSEETCLRTTLNPSSDAVNQNQKQVYVSIDLGKETVVRGMSLLVDPLYTRSNVDIHVGNSGSRRWDTACVVNADVKSSEGATQILCHRAAVDSNNHEEVILSTPDQAGRRTMSSVWSNQAPYSTWGKGSLGSSRGWLTNQLNTNQWQKLDLSRVETIYGIVIDQCNWQWNRYVKSFTIETSVEDNDDWSPIMDGSTPKVFQGGRQDDRTTKYIRFGIGIQARYVKLRPLSWNYHICLRWDVLVTPGFVKGRYVTIFGDTQLSVCEVRVYSEQAPASRSALCSPQEIQRVCVAPTLLSTDTIDTIDSTKIVKWLQPESYVSSVVSVVSSSVATKLAAACGMPRLQIKVDQNRWKTVKTVSNVNLEQNGQAITLNNNREAPLLVSDWTPGKLHIGHLRHVACKTPPSNALAPASRVQSFNWTHVVSDAIPNTPSVPTGTVTGSTLEYILVDLQLIAVTDGTVDKYVLVVEFEEELWFESYLSTTDLPALNLKLPRSLVFTRGIGSVTFHVFACKDGNGCGPSNQLVMTVPMGPQHFVLEEIGSPGDGGYGIKLLSTLPENTNAPISEMKYYILIGQPMLRLTFDDMNDPLRGDTLTNWGSQNRLKTKAVFVGQKSKLFQRSEFDRAVTIRSGSLQGIEINWGNGNDLLGPPFTIGFWFRREVEQSCTDVFWALGPVWHDYIRIYMIENKIYFAMQDSSDSNNGQNRIATLEELPYMEWRYIIVSANADQSHANTQKMQLNVLKPTDLITKFDLHILLKTSFQCSSSNHNLGNADTVDTCAEKCQANSGCKFFIYNSDSKHCHWEKTSSNTGCLEGGETWVAGNMNFYEMPRAKLVHRKNWDSRGGGPDRKIRKTVIGGRQACEATSMSNTKQAKGSFSISDFVVYSRELTKSEKYAEFIVGSGGRGTIDLSSVSTNSIEHVIPNTIVPSDYTGAMDFYAQFCNVFGCSPKISASLGPPTPPQLLNATVDANGQVLLEFLSPVSSGGPAWNNLQ